MANIVTYLSVINNATYGEDMRSAIVGALQAINGDVNHHEALIQQQKTKIGTTNITGSITDSIVRLNELINSLDSGSESSYVTEADLIALANTLGTSINAKVSQSDYDAKIGDVLISGSITDEINRLKERLNEIVSAYGTKAQLEQIGAGVVTDASKVLMVNEDPVSNTKLHLETTDDDIELVEQSEFESRLGPLEDFFTWNWTGDWELGGLNDSGTNSSSSNMIRTVDYLPARTFEITVASGYEVRWFVYNVGKLYVERSAWVTGNTSCDISGVDGAKYMRFAIRTEAGTTISNINTVKSKITVKIKGTSWDGTEGTVSDASVKPYLDENGIIVYP